MTAVLRVLLDADDESDPSLVLNFKLEPRGDVDVTYDDLVELLARLALDAEDEIAIGNRRPLAVYRKIAMLLLVNENKRGRGPVPKSVNLHEEASH